MYSSHINAKGIMILGISIESYWHNKNLMKIVLLFCIDFDLRICYLDPY